MSLWTFDRINIGFAHGKSIWMRFDIDNPDAIAQKTILYLDNPILEHITLYQDGHIIGKSGMLHVNKERHNLYPAFHITAPPKSSQTYYLHVQNTTTALQFALLLSSPEHFNTNNWLHQFAIILYLGMIIAFVLYAIALSLYTKERSYLYYIFYIATLLFQQLTYLGFLPLYMPVSFTAVDNLLVVPKVAIMIIAAALFARAFLKTSSFARIDAVYKSIIAVSFLLIPLTGFQAFYYPEAIVLVGLIFIFLNLFSAIFIYKRGHKQARFFIVGWSFLIIGYLLAIVDALGLFSIMYSIPMLVMIFTAIEALFLLLAFIDRVRILQQQADAYQIRLRHELEKRNLIIQDEVNNQTRTLKNLYKELHHRVKNNLQIILSIIKLQSDTLSDDATISSFLHLENRIRSIAKTHEVLYQEDNIEMIDMSEYLEELCYEIHESLSPRELKFHFDIDASIPLREAVYVGLIVNELISNSIKYALTCKQITISLHQDEERTFFLHIDDDGAGYNASQIKTSSLGLKLVNALVHEQLNGTININTAGKSSYDIRFSL
jgi:two-component sensor histidine kinase